MENVKTVQLDEATARTAAGQALIQALKAVAEEQGAEPGETIVVVAQVQ